MVGTALMLSTAFAPVRLPAQPVGVQTAESQRRISVDITGGASAVRGGRQHYVNDDGMALDLVVGLRRPARRGLMHAIATGIRSDVGDDCYVSITPVQSSGCLPSAPTISHLGLLAGYEYRRSGSSVRALLGPALYSGKNSRGLGGRLHLSAAVGAPRLALTVGVNGHWLALFNGSSLRYYTTAFGLRLQ
ncbi:MAG: hypothetical protein ABMA00_20095 [Gemmatimonas sp.]